MTLRKSFRKWQRGHDSSSSAQPQSVSPVQRNGTLITGRLILLPLEPSLQTAYDAVYNFPDPRAIRIPEQREGGDGETIVYKVNWETPGHMSMSDLVRSTSSDKRGWAAWLLEELKWEGDGDMGEVEIRGSDMPEEVQKKCVAVVGLQGWEENEDRYNEGDVLNRFWTVRARVRDEKRRQGIGTEAYKAMIQALREEGYSVVMGNRHKVQLFGSIDHNDDVGASFLSSLGFQSNGHLIAGRYKAAHFRKELFGKDS